MLWMLAPSLAIETPPPAKKLTDGQFEVLVMAVPDLDKFDQEWAVPSEGANLTTTSRLVRNNPTFVVVLFGGCTKNVQGNCRIDVRHELNGPDGRPYDGLDGTKTNPVAEIPIARTDAFFLAPQLLGVRIETGEALGPYKLRVRVSDLVADRHVTSDLTLTAVEAE
jgi:hypothetical protein